MTRSIGSTGWTVFRPACSFLADPIFLLARDFATTFGVEEQPFRDSLQEILSDDDAILLVSEDQEDVVGYCLGFEHSTFFANGKVAWSRKSW